MARLISNAPFIAIAVFIAAGQVSAYDPAVMKIASPLLAALAAIPVWILSRRKEASAIHKSMALYLVLAAAALLLTPGSLGRALATAPAASLYLVMLLYVALPPLFGREVFTMFFARNTTPLQVWETQLFRRINQHMTLVWALLFALAALSGLMPVLFTSLDSKAAGIIFNFIIPLALLLGFGLPFTLKYPAWFQHRSGIRPAAAGETGSATLSSCAELIKMMPHGFSARAAGNLEAALQFEISGEENFTAHLHISRGCCSFRPRPAQRPDLVVRSPARVWLDVASGRLNGPEALNQGLYQVEGNLNLLIRLNELFVRG